MYRRIARRSTWHTRIRQISRWAAFPVAAALALSGCGATATEDQTQGTTVTDLRMMVPNSSGSGYDVTARSAVRVLEDSKITKGTEVFNVPGAGGTVGLAKMVNESSKENLAMIMGLGLVGASYTNKSSPRLSGTTPIARLIEEQSAVLVSKNSPYRTLEGLITAWKADPKKISVGGGSVPGGPDYLLPMQMAATVGIDVNQVNYVSYDGGGELLPALLGNKVAFATSGAGEYLAQIQSGEVRVLATSGARRSESVPHAPTLREQGLDLEFTNWRGIVAPPGITAEAKAKWIRICEELHSTEKWQQVMKQNGWTDAYLSGPEFDTFMAEQETRVAKVLTDVGLT